MPTPEQVSDSIYLGIDGGGTRLRVTLCDNHLAVIQQREYGSANPGSIGREAARTLIHTAIRETLNDARVTSSSISAAGVGIAGISAEHSAIWLETILCEVLPDSLIALSSDVEIALVGAHGQRRGVLVLAGTGSAVYGVNTSGQAVMVGGWGYLLGDEGSGYWIGLQALRLFTRASDRWELTEQESSSRLPQKIIEQLQLGSPKELIGWIYGEPSLAASRIAGLAPLVLTEADAGDNYAQAILQEGAGHLASMTQTAISSLHEPDLPVAFAGGILAGENILSRSLCAELKLKSLPTAQFPPVIGAVILAKQRLAAQLARGG